jgi:hypothetical protein
MIKKEIKLPVIYDELSWQERREVRNRYVKLQKGLCCHCKSPLNEKAPEKITKMPINRLLFPDNFFSYPVHLHHDRETGLTIGAVHCYCNAVLWEYYGE